MPIYSRLAFELAYYGFSIIELKIFLSKSEKLVL